jgi:hypothetical protein
MNGVRRLFIRIADLDKRRRKDKLSVTGKKRSGNKLNV